MKMTDSTTTGRHTAVDCCREEVIYHTAAVIVHWLRAGLSRLRLSCLQPSFQLGVTTEVGAAPHHSSSMLLLSVFRWEELCDAV